MKYHGALIVGVALIGLAVGCGPVAETTAPTASKPAAKPIAARTLAFSLARYPNVADHIRDAIKAGESSVCTLDREGADERRDAAVKGHAAAKGMDRDEYPFAVCLEGGKGADVRLVPSGENRSAGAWMGNKLEQLPDGTRVLVVVGR